MITLLRKDGGALLGTVDEDDFEVLAGQLVVESETDTDYYIDSATIDLLQARGPARGWSACCEPPWATPRAWTSSGRKHDRRRDFESAGKAAHA